MENQLTITSPELKPVDDPRPESTAFTNVKLYNHLIAHRNKGGKSSFCSIDCMTREFEGRSTESNRAEMRRRLSIFQRWCRDERNKLIEVIKASGNGHGEALAAKIFDPIMADDLDRELIADDLNRARHRKEISEETYQKKIDLVYPMLNETPQENPIVE